MNELRLLACAMLINAGVAAVIGAGLARHMLKEIPAIASVRLTELVAEHAEAAARAITDADETAADARSWAIALEDALGTVAERHGAVLLPARGVAVGAPDLTAEVRAEMDRTLAAAQGGT